MEKHKKEWRENKFLGWLESTCWSLKCTELSSPECGKINFQHKMNINKTLCVRRILLGGRKDSLFGTRQHLHSSMSSDPSCDMVEGEKCKCGIMCVFFFRRSRSLLYLVSREELTIVRVDQKCNIRYIFAEDSLCKSIKTLFVLQFQSCFFCISSRPRSIPLRICPLVAPW